MARLTLLRSKSRWRRSQTGSTTSFRKIGGLSAARNAASRRRRGEFVALLDSDDVWEPDYLEYQLAVLERDGLDVVYLERDDIRRSASLRPAVHGHAPVFRARCRSSRSSASGAT